MDEQIFRFQHQVVYCYLSGAACDNCHCFSEVRSTCPNDTKPKVVAWIAARFRDIGCSTEILLINKTGPHLASAILSNKKSSACNMDAFFQENRDWYIKQVAAFKPSHGHAKGDGGESGGDTSIAARVRPLLPKEIEENENFGITVRSESGSADVHELRRKVNGQPALSVRKYFLP